MSTNNQSKRYKAVLHMTLEMLFLEALIIGSGGQFRLINKFSYAINLKGEMFLIKLNAFDYEYHVLNKKFVPEITFNNYDDLKIWIEIKNKK